MSFVISKLVWGLVAPDSVLVFLLLGALLWQRRRPGLSRGLLGAAVLFLAVLGACPLTHWSISPLERRFPKAPPAAQVDGIVVLGGAVRTQGAGSPAQMGLNDAAERITAAVALARRYPDARIVYSGGSGLLRDQSTREADGAQYWLSSMGVAGDRVIYERDSRNTWENAVYSKKLARPKPGETWLLVTSAWHMPRAVGCFRKAGWEVQPYPVDYEGTNRGWLSFDLGVQLHIVGLAEKEWIGLVSYYLLGRTDALFPSPRPPN